MIIDTTAMMTRLPLTLATPVPSVDVADTDNDGAIPAELRAFATGLRLLDGVPFAYLVADTELLPPESIRFFYVDRRWTDAAVQGALSVGTVNSDDRTQLTANYPAIRDELDREERNLRRRKGTPRWSGDAGPISGFILRSQAVSGWPGIHVRAFTVDVVPDDARATEDDPTRMRILRLERLAPAVLLCLFDGIPKVVHIEEPRQGVQFGFDQVAGAGTADVGAQFIPRNAATSKDLARSPVRVPFRAGGAPGVVDIQALERTLSGIDGTGATDGLNSAEYALQLIRFPWRQVFGEARRDVSAEFAPSISYARVVSTFREDI